MASSRPRPQVIRLTDAAAERIKYVMANATKPIIETSNFIDNSNDVGECTGATKDNTPVLMNNNYKKGTPTIDASCFTIGTTDSAPMTTAYASAGPSGL